jgi:cation:H+ antiporter
MLVSIGIFIIGLTTLLFSAKFFSNSAEKLGKALKLPEIVVGIFIVGIGTSIPELISGVLSVYKGSSEILPGNIVGANISNLLFITGIAVAVNRKNIVLKSRYLYIDLHFLLGSFMFFGIIAYDGLITFSESFIGFLIFIVYSIYLVKGEHPLGTSKQSHSGKIPIKEILILVISSGGIYFGAEFTISGIEDIATLLNVPKSIIALTALSIGTTLPELAVNINFIRENKAEMAVGNILGSSVFNTLFIAPFASLVGPIQVPESILNFPLPVMVATGVLFYLLAQDKRISIWEGLMLVCLYLLFLIKIVV